MLKRVSAVLMASGFSHRFSQGNKLLYPFHGVPMGTIALELFTRMNRFHTLSFVCASPEVAALAEGFPVQVIHNPNPEKGQRESIRLGVEAAPADGYLFCPCDQPLLTQDTVEGILAQGQEGRIVVPTYAGTPGSPVLFSASFAEELQALQEGETGKTLFQRHPKSVLFMELNSPWPLADVDTLADVKRLEGRRC